MTITPRILALVGSRVLYGQERANLLVMETLKADGCEILAVVESNSKFRDHPMMQVMPEELRKRGIPYVEAPAIGRRAEGHFLDFLIGNPIRYFQFRKKLRRVVRDWRPTHLHVPNPFAFLMARAIVPSGVPIIYRIGDQPALHNALWRWLWRHITRSVTHFVADSKFIADQLNHLGVNQDRTTVLYTPPIRRSAPPQPEIKPEHPQHILFLGQLIADKGVDRLIEAFRQVAPDYPEARLTLVGRISGYAGDNWQRALRDQALADPTIASRISFVGEQEDIYGYLASCAFLVVPSVCEEAFGMVVGEAKAAARPSVIFPRGGLQEQVMHRQDGFICSDTSSEALAEGLSYYLNDPDLASGHGRAALASLETFETHKFGEKWRQIYDITCARGDQEGSYDE